LGESDRILLSRKVYVKDLIGFAALVMIVFMMVYLIQQFIPGG
jgi:hypothetical protein